MGVATSSKRPCSLCQVWESRAGRIRFRLRRGVSGDLPERKHEYLLPVHHCYNELGYPDVCLESDRVSVLGGLSHALLCLERYSRKERKKNLP